MTRGNLKKFIGRKCGLIGADGASWVDGYVLETDVNELINVRGLELFEEFAEAYPEFYEVPAFKNLAEDQSKYLLEAGDTSTDFLEPRALFIKYSTSATKYTRMKKVDWREIEKYDTAPVVSQTTPRYSFTSLKDTETGEKLKGIKIYPTPTENVTNGLKMVYVELPPDLTQDADSFETIPSTSHKLIGMAVIADVWEMKQDWNQAERAMNRYLYQKQKFFENYQPANSDEPAFFTPDVMFNPKRFWRGSNL